MHILLKHRGQGLLNDAIVPCMHDGDRLPFIDSNFFHSKRHYPFYNQMDMIRRRNTNAMCTYLTSFFHGCFETTEHYPVKLD